MLVLSRRCGESIVINDNIQVTIVAVSGNRVRLGITAPESVSVDRQEIHERRNEFASNGADAVHASRFSAQNSAVCAPERRPTTRQRIVREVLNVLERNGATN